MNEKTMLDLIEKYCSSKSPAECWLGQYLQQKIAVGKYEEVIEIVRNETFLLEEALDNFDKDWADLGGE